MWRYGRFFRRSTRPYLHASIRSCVVVLILALSLLCLHCGPPRSEAEDRLARACAYLWGQQDEDGGWHSTTYGLLRGGQAWTPFVLHALLTAPDTACPRPKADVEKALAFIRRHVNEDGALGLADSDVLEYPNYATAYGLRVLARHGGETSASYISRMTAYLLGQQFAEERGVEPDDAAYGSWGFGETHLPPGRTGHIDLSHTRRVLEALREAGYEVSAPYHRAEAFLQWAQKHPSERRIQAAPQGIYDGGFFASPVVAGVNKSAPTPGAPERIILFDSYATATCDGLLALLAAGVTRDDERIRAAVQWLRMHPELAYPEGIPPDHPAQWRRVLFYYHLSVRAEVYRRVEEPGTWRDDLVRLLASHQRVDGSFANPYGAANKEDDPLLATAMAILALSATVP